MKQNTTFLRAGSPSVRRAALLGTVAAGALCVVAQPAAAGPDACTTSVAGVTCSGNQSGGIDAGVDFTVPPVTTLNINNLTQDIAPTALGDGIRWAMVGAGPINVISNTGPFSINAESSGMNLAGIGAAIGVTHTGNINASYGISARSFGVGPTLAGTVSVTMNGNIVSTGTGIFATSQVAAGNGDTAAVTVDFTGNIVSRDQAIRADSSIVGNGNSGQVTIKSRGSLVGDIEASSIVAANGNAGAVDILHQGSLGLGTLRGIQARSLVGGIGNAAGVSVINAGNIISQAGAIFASSRAQTDGNAGIVVVQSTGDLSAGGIAISAGSTANATGSAGSVLVDSAGNIRTNGSGISALSLAAGTGNANLATVYNTGHVDAGGAIAIAAQSSAATGNAGAVTVASTGNLTNKGPTAALLATSTVSGGTGNAAGVAVTSVGDINATAGGRGIWALSESAGGNAGAVTVAAYGNITAQGPAAILAQSLAPAGTAGNISVSINDGVVSGNLGVVLEGGANNLLSVGSKATLSGLSGDAVLGGAGNETINNSGVVTGSIELGDGTNAFNNLAGATFNAGALVDLGAAGLLSNAGTLAPGGRGTAPVTTALNGNLVQTAGGTFAVDVRNGAADRVNTTGTAALAGTVLPTVNGLAAPTQHFTILSAAGGTTNNGITLAVQDTAVLDYSLLFPNANDMVLAVTANFLPTGANLTPNQRVTAGHLQGALVGGGGNLDGLLGYLSGFMDVGAYAKALDRLHPEPYLAQVQSGLLANLAFTDGLMSCPTVASPNASAFVAEGQCVWARMGARALNVTRSTANIGYDDNAWGGSAGVQVALAPSWFGSLAFGYERSDLRVDNRARASGDLFHAGAGVKYVRGNWQVTGALSGGHASYDTTRLGVMPGVNASADPSMSFLSGRVRAAYVIGNDNAYVKPLVDLDATTIRRGGFIERGAAAAGLNVRGQTDTVLSVAPAVEVGGQYALTGATWLRPFVRAGVRVFGNDELSATASFIGSPPAVPAFTATTPLDRWMGEVASGLEILSGDRFDARLGYEGRFGERATQHGGNLKLRAKF